MGDQQQVALGLRKVGMKARVVCLQGLCTSCTGGMGEQQPVALGLRQAGLRVWGVCTGKGVG